MATVQAAPARAAHPTRYTAGGSGSPHRSANPAAAPARQADPPHHGGCSWPAPWRPPNATAKGLALDPQGRRTSGRTPAAPVSQYVANPARGGHLTIRLNDPQHCTARGATWTASAILADPKSSMALDSMNRWR